jgi:hypothetical protein
MRKISTLLSPNYITCRLQGRTGNIMFQIAHAYAKALEYNRQFVVPFGEAATQHLESTLFSKIPFNIKTFNQSIDTKTVWANFRFEEVIPHENTPTAFAGWYQSEKYFSKYTEAVIDLFSPPLSFIQKALDIYPFFTNKTVAAINVRRGDYLTQSTRHPTITKEYILKAYEQLPDHDKLLIVSDDIPWCMENINLPNIIFNDNNNFWDGEAMWLLSLCDHFILSNSTFSWWGAYLSRSDNKVIIAPDTWFGPDMESSIDPSDIYCDNWTILNTYYEDGQIKI